MRTNIEIDDKLMKQVMRCTGASTKRAAVEAAMRQLVRSQHEEKLALKTQKRVLTALRGSAKWEGNLEESRISRFLDREPW